MSVPNPSNARPSVAFLIPARNEERWIGPVVESIHRVMESVERPYQVWLLDHGSTDLTRERAAEQGATVLDGTACTTIAALRNFGAEKSHGSVLVFLDGDVSLGEGWAQNAQQLIDRVDLDTPLLTGSEVIPPEGAGWIERVWFGVEGKDRSHVNSGHLIVGRAFFEKLGGFDAQLVTGEDYDLSQRARAAQAEIDPQPGLTAYHHGYPATLKQFFRREIWHGVGSMRSIKDLTDSKVGWITLLILLSVPLAGLLFALTGLAWSLALPLLALLGFSGLATLVRPRLSTMHLPQIFFLYNVYFTGRCCSLFQRLMSGDSHWKG